jgi:hypothetical protein
VYFVHIDHRQDRGLDNGGSNSGYCKRSLVIFW